MDFASVLGDRLAAYDSRPCVEFEHRWHTGYNLTDTISEVNEALIAAGISRHQPVGLVVRNRVPHAAVILGAVAAGRPLVMIYSYQSATAIARDIATMRLPAIIADESDWSAAALEAARHAGSAAVCVTHPVRALAPRSTAHTAAEPGLHILTSGTTGPPKRVAIAPAVLEHTVLSMTLGQTVSPDDPPALVFWPFGSVGVCQLLAAAYSGQRIVLLEKFTVEAWVRAIKEHHIATCGVQPTVIRMLLASEVTAADLASLEYLPGGSGPLEPELQRAFEDRFGIPLLWGYGATEFAGTVATWTPQLRARYGDSKPGTVGRPLPGVAVRIVNPGTGHELPTGSQGLLSARVDLLGPKWITTTDVASVDDDGFLTVHGRGDGAINRGGFKVLPERVRRVLLAHPAVYDACVVSVPDPRLGEVPFAAVEVRVGHSAPTEEELKELVRESLPAPSIPVAIAVVDEFPRNAAMKVRVDAVAAWYQGSTESGIRCSTLPRNDT